MISHKSLSLVPTKQPDTPTIQATMSNKKIYLYSKYNPNRDSQVFAEEAYDEFIDNYIVYGLGLGYHIQKLEKMLIDKGKKFHIYVVESNKELFKLAKKSINLDRILANENISFLMMENDKESYEKLGDILRKKDLKLSIHGPSLDIIPTELIELKHVLEEFILKQNNIDIYGDRLDNNFKYNIRNYDKNVDILFNRRTNKALFLIAAGPSLDKNIYELSKVKDRGIILSVGRAVRPLLKAGITPDYIVITDPSDFLYDRQLKGLDIDVPIIVLSTCDKNVMKNYKGLKYIALQEGYLPAEEYAKKNNHALVSTGGSVATTGLDIAIKMGCNPIVFVGQDLAFTDNKSHAKDTFSREMKEISTSREVEDIYGNTIKTYKNLYIYLRWIQNRIAEESHIEFIDATEAGARIKGTKLMKLKDTIVLKAEKHF